MTGSQDVGDGCSHPDKDSGQSLAKGIGAVQNLERSQLFSGWRGVCQVLSLVPTWQLNKCGRKPGAECQFGLLWSSWLPLERSNAATHYADSEGRVGLSLCSCLGYLSVEDDHEQSQSHWDATLRCVTVR